LYRAIDLVFGCRQYGRSQPSELTPFTSSLLKGMIAEIFEEELVTVVEGGPEVSTHLLSLPFDHIFFTGSPLLARSS